MDIKHTLISIFIMIGITQILRFLPFLLFKKKSPQIFIYLGKVLPFSIMAMLVVYCLRNINIRNTSVFSEIISIVVIFIFHKWKHNYLLSIVAGTLCYMFLIQKIFI